MKLLLLLAISCSCLVAISLAALRFTNLKCLTHDKSLVTFEECNLKVLRRNVVGLNTYAKVHKLPLTEALVNVALFKKASGYRPFLYNITVDICKFFKNRKRMPFMNIMYSIMINSSNVNHTCPYTHDLIIHNLVLEVAMFEKLPLPAGEYMTKLKVGLKNKQWKFEFNIYYLISNNL